MDLPANCIVNPEHSLAMLARRGVDALLVEWLVSLLVISVLGMPTESTPFFNRTQSMLHTCSELQVGESIAWFGWEFTQKNTTMPSTAADPCLVRSWWWC